MYTREDCTRVGTRVLAREFQKKIKVLLDIQPINVILEEFNNTTFRRSEMKMMQKDGGAFEVHEHIMTKNMWELSTGTNQ